MFLTGARFTAERAREIGLVHAVVDAAGMDAAVAGYIQEFLSAGPAAIAAAKALIPKVAGATGDAVIAMTAEAIADMRVSPEGQEGLRAFLEKRRASWRAGASMIRRLLIANRGEIAVRIMRACDELGIETVAVYSDADASALARARGSSGVSHRPAARRPRAICRSRGSSRPPGRPAPTRCIRATDSWPRTRRSPGACGDAGLIFVGPPPEAIAAMGSKITARAD